jgi:hypothetical protein
MTEGDTMPQEPEIPTQAVEEAAAEAGRKIQVLLAGTEDSNKDPRERYVHIVRNL